MIILDSVKLDYDDLLIVPQCSELDSRADVDLLREYKFPWCNQTLKCTGIIASNMYNTGTIRMAESLSKFNLLTALHKFHIEDELVKVVSTGILNERVFITIGEDENAFEKIKRVGSRAFDQCDIFMNRLMVCIDVANAYRTSFIDFIKKFRDIFPECLLMAGNVTTPDGTRELIKAGVDIVKIGIGPGSVCETRRVAGVGYPMASACIECADAAHGLKGRICADGGCRTVGDICKAFCLEADFVMCGGLFAGADECDGEWEYDNLTTKTNRRLKFFGMSSREAMEKFGGIEHQYRASEGSVSWIDYKGPASAVAREILGGLRSCCTYLGAQNLREMPRRASLVRINK